LGIKVRPIAGLAAYGSYTHRTPLIVRDIADPQNEGKQIPFVAEDMFSLGVEYQLARRASAPCGALL
jgi:hypothetical protein